MSLFHQKDLNSEHYCESILSLFNIFSFVYSIGLIISVEYVCKTVMFKNKDLDFRHLKVLGASSRVEAATSCGQDRPAAILYCIAVSQH